MPATLYKCYMLQDQLYALAMIRKDSVLIDLNLVQAALVDVEIQ
jgi:hypothetical protein